LLVVTNHDEVPYQLSVVHHTQQVGVSAHQSEVRRGSGYSFLERFVMRCILALGCLVGFVGFLDEMLVVGGMRIALAVRLSVVEPY
jgi:hypothetical protein